MDLTENNPPQLITRAEIGFGAKAWIKAIGPEMSISFWGYNPFELSILEILGMSNTLLDDMVDIQYTQSLLPFEKDNNPPFSQSFGETGIYINDYSKLTDIDVVRLFAKIPQISKIACGKVGFARGFKGDIDLILNSIEYYKDNNYLVGEQVYAKLGVDVSQFKGTTLNITKREYNVELIPSVTAGIAAHIVLISLAFHIKAIFQNLSLIRMSQTRLWLQ